MGYAFAKYAAEKIIQSAVNERPELRATIVRCGQISGSLTTGAWPRAEYIPRLLRACMEMGIIPEGLEVSLRWPLYLLLTEPHFLGCPMASGGHCSKSFIPNGAGFING
jgi:hypothetical protein